nr:MAG TPA: Cell cycle protein [Caudoviricetes sp.]DAJ33957.1 MAG TPA: Cell cycle protein [Caudoviricetes sp.]
MITGTFACYTTEHIGNHNFLRGFYMNTADKVINDLAIQLANKVIECANYKALYEEAQTQLQQLQAEKEAKEK